MGGRLPFVLDVRGEIVRARHFNIFYYEFGMITNTNVWDKWPKMSLKPNRGPLDEKNIFFFKKPSDLDKSKLKISEI